MKILLIAPATGKWRRVGRSGLFRGRTFRFSLSSLLTVAAETPGEDEVEIADEQVEAIPWDEPWDLVGVSAMTAAAPRAYEIAARFRCRGIPVVLGGMHPTFLPGEALRHADAVCVGEAETVWPRILEDARRGRLGGAYRAEQPPDLAGLRPIPRHLLRRRDYGTIQAVQATRGCPRRCSFCSITAFHGGAFRRRPVGDVVREVESLRRRFVIFVDDNLTADRGYARELFRALAPLRKVWISQSELSVTNDEELVRLASAAGCIGLFVGLESFSAANLFDAAKRFNRVEEYRDRVRLLHDSGIGVEAGMVFGFDHDGPEVFRETLDRLEEIEIDMVQVSIRTPLPGTPELERLHPRILDRNWAHYDYHHVVFEPRLLSAEALQAGHDWVTREFYRPFRIARRLARMARRPGAARALPFAAAINAAYFGRVVRWRIRGWDPAEELTPAGHGPGGPPEVVASGRAVMAGGGS